MNDIAILTGGKVIDDTAGVTFENVDGSELGIAQRVVVTKDSTTIIGSDDKSAVEKHIAHLEQLAKNTESEYLISKINERIAKLSGGVVVVKVGGATETEMKEKRDRADDALCAVRAAREEGIIVGGGAALAKISEQLSHNLKSLNGDVLVGYRIALTAMQAPIRQIAYNADQSGDVVYERVSTSKDASYGYNARSNLYTDLLTDGIIDPVKVTRLALTYAASVAGLMLTTSCMITDEDTKPE
jgi:chaperonin GroEL